MSHHASRRLGAMATWIVILAATSLTTAAAVNPAAPPADLASVLSELRAGGLVIYFRHASTDQTGATDEDADMAKCETQRNLSASGRKQATKIGEAFHALGIPVGTVTTSPFCRCKDTAQLAFGRFTVSDDLYYSIGTDISETRRSALSLRRMLSAVPATRANAVIVSHTANLREATSIWPGTEGMAYVFRPSREGVFEVIAKVMPEDWGNLARRESSAQSKSR